MNCVASVSAWPSQIAEGGQTNPASKHQPLPLQDLGNVAAEVEL